MRFDFDKLSELLIKAKGDIGINEFSRRSNIGNSYISNIVNKKIKIKSAPSPEILRRISEASCGKVSYIEFMLSCGYITEQDIEEIKKNY